MRGRSGESRERELCCAVCSPVVHRAPALQRCPRHGRPVRRGLRGPAPGSWGSGRPVWKQDDGGSWGQGASSRDANAVVKSREDWCRCAPGLDRTEVT